MVKTRVGARVRRGLLPLFALAAAMAAGWPAAADVFGRARVIDGDTLHIARQMVSLYGIDAPEADQICRRGGATWHCGEEAMEALRTVIGDEPVWCMEIIRNRDGHIVAICDPGDGDIAGKMVKAGMAVADRLYSSRYVAAERSARIAERGMWGGQFVRPSEWRRGKRLDGVSLAADGAGAGRGQ